MDRCRACGGGVVNTWVISKGGKYRGGGRVTVRRIISASNITASALKYWKEASRKTLNQCIRPKTPYRLGPLRASLWQRTTVDKAGNVRTTFTARTPYARRFEEDKAWIKSITLHTAGTRAPYLEPGIEEGEPFYEEAVRKMVEIG